MHTDGSVSIPPAAPSDLSHQAGYRGCPAALLLLKKDSSHLSVRLLQKSLSLGQENSKWLHLHGEHKHTNKQIGSTNSNCCMHVYPRNPLPYKLIFHGQPQKLICPWLPGNRKWLGNDKQN